MIKCERCGSDGPFVSIEAHDYLKYCDVNWELCENCYILFKEVMSKFIHTTHVVYSPDGSGLMVTSKP